MSALLVGYARCSTDQQDLTAQRDGLLALGVEADRIYVDHGLTGTNRERPGLREALAACRAGDTLVVTKLDRLARSLPDARAIADELDHPGDQPQSRRVGLRPYRRRRAAAVQRPGHGGRVLCYLDTPGRSPAGAGCCGLMTWAPAREAGVRVVKEREDGVVRRVVLVDDGGDEVVPVNRFLSHLFDAGYSPNTVCAYGYDLRHLALFLAERSLGWNDFRPATALEFLGYLRRVPSRRPAQRLGLTVATEQGRLLSPATVQRVLAATSSFFDWAIAAEQYTSGENPMQRRIDHALGRVPERHQPFVGAASRQQPIRRTVRVRLPLRSAAADEQRGHRRTAGQPDDDAGPGDLLADARRRTAPGRGAVPAAGRHLLRAPSGHGPQARRPSSWRQGEGPHRARRGSA